MPPVLRNIRQRIFRFSPDETNCARRGFHDGGATASVHLEQVGRAFVYGYDAALGDDDLQTLARRLDCLEPEWRGFAFEGAAMALTLMDHLLPWKTNRLNNFLNGAAAPHVYMIHVGVGWAIGRLLWLRRNVDRWLNPLDSLLRWLAVDGYGFHEGYFHWSQSVVKQEIPKQLGGYGPRAFDQGLGRSLWFVDGADVNRIPITIGKFPIARQADLWSGVGLACAYAGGVNVAAIETLRLAAGRYLPELAQGAAFAAKARLQAGITVEHTEAACQILCGQAVNSCAAVTEEALADLPTDGEEPAYEIWRQRIRATFAARN